MTSASNPNSLFYFIQSLRDTRDELHFAWNSSRKQREMFTQQAYKFYTAIPHADLILTVIGTLSASLLIRRSLHRYKNANDLPLEFFAKQKRLKGLAVLVNDSDNIRFYHRPHFYSFFKPNLSRQDLKYHTINVRLAGIDAPEMAHFGMSPQPFALEAKEWLTTFVQGRPVKIQLHRIDQYGRAVATVLVRRSRWPWMWWPVWWNVSLEMVRAGFATIYRDSGAEYGTIKEALESAELKARKSKLGMWSLIATTYQSPSEFKKMNRMQAVMNAVQKSSQVATEQSKPKMKFNFFSQSNSNRLKTVSLGK